MTYPPLLGDKIGIAADGLLDSNESSTLGLLNLDDDPYPEYDILKRSQIS